MSFTLSRIERSTMMKRMISLALTCILLIGALPLQGLAADAVCSEIIHLEDGTYLEITMACVEARASGTKSGKKIVHNRNADDSLNWTATLSASFTYNGSSSVCTRASCTVEIFDTEWYEISNATTRSGNTATAELKMGHKFLGITIAKPTYTIKLSCDKDGNLS